jgi:hypothetical protein
MYTVELELKEFSKMREPLFSILKKPKSPAHNAEKNEV